MAVLPKKRNEPPLTPAASVDGSEGPSNIAHQQPQGVEGGLDATSPAVLPKKRNEPPLTPAASVDGSEGPSNIQQPQSFDGDLDTKAEDHDKVQEPPKKKRRVALTRVGDLAS